MPRPVPSFLAGPAPAFLRRLALADALGPPPGARYRPLRLALLRQRPPPRPPTRPPER